MNRLMPAPAGLPAMSPGDVDKVGKLEGFLGQLDQVAIATTHHFHAGLYARTIRIPAGVIITGALIKIPTLLILSGHATVFIGDDSLDLQGYHVLPGHAGRKQVFLAHVDTDLTMVFASQASTVEEAEAEFTDETDNLGSRRQNENLIIEGR
ncbi:hypothetical protein [Ectopseudomonas alcaliphila]|uniref:Uncharacterized protein n=1 Tax=Ectopseudomonas alcaliphila TaxID=101564 RepID=A0A1G7JHK1_9GAMM|nr:hypothetical protein [Pseudomonas alcaliphila]MDX5990472.1 hypothetical protein [Pseudomonas alcaliphila]MDX5995442.1 hypothetical protein [Pseudomonas alcaliphila]MDX5995487.1 hypothetical protein [Pseudomonas alcaliphila]SDF23969.1 hypothetical protein SAMN05216575_106222 [Pseudomonas alcaliphila]